MFLTADVQALFKKATLKLVSDDDGVVTRAAEASIVFDPFTVELAREMGEDIASHLFTDDDQIRAELSSVHLRPRVGALRVSARTVADMPATIIEPVGLSAVVAKVCEDKKSGTQWLELTCVLLFSLESKLARDFVLDSFGRMRLWTFEPLQRDLLAQAAIHDAAARLGELSGDGCSVTIIDPDGTRVEINAETAQAQRAMAKSLRRAANA